MRRNHKKWTDAELEILRKELNITSRKELSVKLGRTEESIKLKARDIGLSIIRVSKVWGPERDKQLRELYPRKTNEEIAEIMGTTEGAIVGRSFVLGLRKDPDWLRERSSKTFFRKGHIPINKGKTWDDYMPVEKQANIRKTQFKKGHIPANSKPVGHERKTRDGYIEVKVAESERYKHKHRLLWEQHYGPIPKGKNVSFKDGDKTNITIENLMLESCREKFNRCCSIHRKQIPEEFRKLVQLKGVLHRQINKINKNKEEENHGKRIIGTTEENEQAPLGVPQQGR